MHLTASEDFSSLAPPLDDATKDLLRQSLKEDGCVAPLIVWKGKGIIVDGHNRYAICEEEGIEYKILERAFESKTAAQAFAIRTNLERRNLTPAQRTVFALQYVHLLAPKAKDNLRTPTGGRKRLTLSDARKSSVQVDEEIAKAAKVSRETVYKVRRVLEEGKAETKQALKEGRISVAQAYRDTFPGVACDDYAKEIQRSKAKPPPTPADETKLQKVKRLIKGFNSQECKRFIRWIDKWRAQFAGPVIPR